ncbi:hypothetical protein [Breznakia pachnodae]|uniref:Uncharacterized protein n=1 Tax=Breznakia pachnodae TaxID=265178 RepID=A0ABU0E3S6_9FIRM|nr:hypothetical protein [Breznakia pachnodae]MDQ0361544.1 hypothetical protein [Breznakia pachnodae]
MNDYIPQRRSLNTEELKRVFPDYRKDDYVLWIIMDLFVCHAIEEVKGQVIIETSKGDQIIPFDDNQIVKKPYINKRIWQIAAKQGRKKTIGIPIVFNSFEEMSDVTKVFVRWDCEYLSYMCDEPFNFSLSVCIAEYELSFTKNENDRIYALYSKSTLLCDTKHNRNNYSEVVGCIASLDFDDGWFINEYIDYTSASRKITKEETTFLANLLNSLEKEKNYFKDRVNTLSIPVDSEIDVEIIRYKVKYNAKPLQIN